MTDELMSRCAPYLPDLRAYCHQLTGSTWDADDLFQETWARVYQALSKQPHRPLSKTYLRQIAKNIWIDQWRKKRPLTEPLGEEMVSDLPDDVLSIREAFEMLAERLSVRQMVLILLLDVFNFTAREAAQLLQATEGAVKEGVKRARRRLQELANEPQEAQTRTFAKPSEPLNGNLFETFLHAFRSGNPQAICESYLSLKASGVQVVQANRAGGRWSFTFRDPDGHMIRVFSEISP